MAFLGPGPQAQRPQPWSSEFDPRLGLPSLSKLWAASGCRSKLLMKRPVAAECGRLSPEWRHGRSCCRAAKGLEQQEFLSCGPSGTGWGAGGLCSGIPNHAVRERVQEPRDPRLQCSYFVTMGNQSLERVSNLPKVTQLVTKPSSWVRIDVTSGFHLTLGDKSNE